MPVKLPPTAGARPDQMNITFSPSSSNCLRLPERKPSPKPTNKSKEPTPQAIPNMVRNDRSLCAQSVRRVWLEISKSRRIASYNHTRGKKLRFHGQRSHVLLRRLEDHVGNAEEDAGLGLVAGRIQAKERLIAEQCLN